MSVDLVGFVKLVGVGYGLPRLKYVVQAITRGLATTFFEGIYGKNSWNFCKNQIFAKTNGIFAKTQGFFAKTQEIFEKNQGFSAKTHGIFVKTHGIFAKSQVR